jgi:hypothetical protein
MKLRTIVVAVAVAGLPGACSTAPPRPVTVAPPLPNYIVPAGVPAENITIQADETKDIRQAVQSAGPQILTSDVKFWEIHSGPRLVGALQLSTLKSRVNPAHAADRSNIISQVLLGPSQEIYIDGLPVWTTPSGGSPRAIYIWFGQHDFGVLQLQAQDVNSSLVSTDVITDIVSHPAWQALPPEDYSQ